LQQQLGDRPPLVQYSGFYRQKSCGWRQRQPMAWLHQYRVNQWCASTSTGLRRVGAYVKTQARGFRASGVLEIQATGRPG